ncbi:unnamed protein product [Dovyalis caffra]|uniref:Uncharacterized protein n=1 Tax=Dovyalis caffra TaxID=77055 RepID=A0AAV1RDU3_9ROSI|nr:unnamed protein product [Dovyalis caffra]
MVEGTRLQELDESLLLRWRKLNNAKRTRLNKSIDELKSLIGGLSVQYRKMLSSKNVEETSQFNQRDIGDKRNTHFSYGSSHKLDFPKFDGKDFEVKSATSQLSERALQWHQGYVKLHGLATYEDWKMYIRSMRPRFGL